MTAMKVNQFQSVTLLLADDDDGDVRAIERAFRKAEIVNPIVRAIDGVDALEILQGVKGKGCLKPPYILLVDLNMPRMSGMQLLEHVRQDENLKRTVVFVLTTSKRDEDINAAYNLNVAGYIYKDSLGQDFGRLVELMDCYSHVVEIVS